MKLEIYNRLRDRILHVEYEPGSILNEQALAEEFNVSRTPMRTVLFKLEWEHLVKILPRTGIQITELELNRIMNVYQARLELEDVIGKMAARRFTAEHFKKLESLAGQCHDLMDKKDPRALSGIDMGIKALFHDAAANPYLTETSDRLYALTFRLWYFNMLKMDTNEWNQEIIAVKQELADLSSILAGKDPADVGQARRQHLMAHLERIRTKFFSLTDSL